MASANRVRRTEVPGLGLILLAGFLLSALARFYPANMPVWAPWEFSWAEYLGTVLPLFWYALGVTRMQPGQ
jgi:putative membrane protein